jgi:SAM-dependent methyltransferase
MIRYALSATALKCFSSTSFTRRLYRKIGNVAGNRRRSAKGALPEHYKNRAASMLRFQRKYGLLRDGDALLEVGTGWVHWDALMTRLLFDVRAVLFDVWDNRQFDALKHVVSQLGQILARDGLSLSEAETRHAQHLIGQILAARSFDEVYELLGFEYKVEPSGSLADLESGSFQLVVSGGVLEHIDREFVPTLIQETFRVTKPGGWAIHSIDIQDHLSYYDPKVPRKQYLAFSDKTWGRFFQNQVQYFNRIQRSD